MSTFRPPPQQRDFVTFDGGRYTVDPIWLQWFIDLVSQVNTLNAATEDPTTLVQKSVTMNNGAGAALGTLGNAPFAGNPTKWIPFDDNGVVRHFPSW
jgi:hypothetical protein